MSEEEVECFSISSISDGDDEVKDTELMKDIIQSIEHLRRSPKPSVSPVPESFTDSTDPNPVDLNSLTLIELYAVLDQISKGLDLNSKLQNALLVKEVKLLSLKRQLQALARAESKMSDDDSKNDIGKYIVQFKAPYFKDDKNFAGYNIVPEKDMPVLGFKYEKATPWTRIDLHELECSIKNFLSRRELELMMETQPSTLKEKQKVLNTYAQLRKASLNTLVTDNFNNIIDWCHIASRMKRIHSPYECQKAWDIFLKPGINKKKWSKVELAKLKRCALENNYEDWEAIAEKLGTNRSAYQCFHEYVDVVMKLQEGEWSKSEEEFLIKLVKDCTYGEKVLWHKVSYYFETRSLAQIYRKWNLSAVGKTNKAGPFDEEEDQVIIDSLILKCGDINLVARRLNRLPSQIRYRFAQLKNSLQHRFGEWSLEEDKQLMSLVDRYGTKKWALIAEHLRSRGRVQIRHRYENIRKKLEENPGKKLEELFRPKRPSHKTRKRNNTKYFLEKTLNLCKNSQHSQTVNIKQEPCDDGLEVEAPFESLVLCKEDVDEVVGKRAQKGKKRDKRKQILKPKVMHEIFLNHENRDVENSGEIQPSTSNDGVKRNSKRNKTKKVSAQKLPAEVSSAIMNYYSSITEYSGELVKPSDVCDGEFETEIANAFLKFKPYKYFDKDNADWWYGADRSDPYYKSVFGQVERKVKDEYETKEGANWVMPPCMTSLEGFHNLLVDIGYKPDDFEMSQDEVDEELKELYCTMDEETIGAVAKWKERLKTLFLWPAVLSEIELDKTEEDYARGNQSNQVLNESEIIQLAEELNQIEDDDLRAVMVKQLGLVDGSIQNKDNTEQLSMLVLHDDSSVEVVQTNPESHDNVNMEQSAEEVEILNNLKSEPVDSVDDIVTEEHRSNP